MNPPPTSFLQRILFPKFGVVIFLRWLFSWRIIRRMLFFLACLATLTAIFYAEEDWRGHRAWEKCKREYETKGYRLEWRSFIPPPIPDEQNFALSRFFAEAQRTWRKRQNRMEEPYDTNWFAHLALGLNLPLTGSGHPLPAFSDWQTGSNTDLPAWQKYYHQPMTNSPKPLQYGGWDGMPFPVSPQNQPADADVLLALTKYDDVLRLLRSDAQKPFSRFPIDYEDPTYSILLPHLSRLKHTAMVIQLQTAALLESGKTKEAAANVKLIFYLADSIKTEPFLISYLVRAAIFQISLDVIWEGMNQHRWSTEQLALFEQKLGDADMLRSYIIGIEAEISGHCLFIDQLRSDPEVIRQIGMLTDQETATDSFSKQSFKRFYRLAFIKLAPKGWFDQLKAYTIRAGFDYVLDAVNPETGRVDLKTSESPQAHAELLATRSRFWIFDIILGDYDRTLRRAVRTQMAIEIGATACALERYWITNGNYPEKLDELVPQFIKKVPVEVINGEPLKYRREANGRFVLYSTGLSGQDFGGARRYANVKFDDNWVWSKEPR